MSNHHPSPRQGGGNLRPCPALPGLIKPADCGARRGSELSCPPDCSFYPFGTAAFDLFRKVDDSCVTKIGQFLLKTWGVATLDRLLRGGLKLYEGHPRCREFAAGHLIDQGLLQQRGPDGKSAAEIWESQKWEGLNNDERILMRHRCQSYLTVIEIQKRASAQTVLATDLFRPEHPPFIIMDQSLAEHGTRFARCLTWLTHYPHFSRPAANAFEIPAHLWPDWRDRIREQYEKQRSDDPDLSLAQYLAGNLETCARLIPELVQQERQKILASLDLTACAAVYQLTSPVLEIENVLRNKPEFEPGPPPKDSKREIPHAFFTWRCQGESAEFELESSQTPPGTSAKPIGSVWLYADQMVVETISRKRHAFIQRMVEKHLGPQVKFEKEVIMDLAEIQALRAQAQETVGRVSAWLDYQEQLEAGASSGTETVPQTTPGPNSDPPADSASSLDRRRQQIEVETTRYYRRFLDEPLAALDNQTPRQAARNPSLRSRLVEVMKAHLNHVERRSRREGVPLNIDGVLEELGLSELK